MSVAVQGRLAAAPARSRSPWADALEATVRYLRRNPSLIIGLSMLLFLLLFVVVGQFIVDVQRARPLSARAIQPPSWALPFGTDRQGRDLFAVMVAGTPLTFRIGLIAGFLGVTFGA